MKSTEARFTLNVYRLSREGEQPFLYLGTTKSDFGNGFPNIKSYEGLSEEQFSKAAEIVRNYRGDESGLVAILGNTLSD